MIDSYTVDEKSVNETMELMRLSRVSVNFYLPYKDVTYKMSETSVDANRERLCFTLF